MNENIKNNKVRSKHGMVSNTWFMIRLAWDCKEKKVPLLTLLYALLSVGLNLVNLYVSPTILAVVEKRGSVKELMWTILSFVAAMMLLSASARYVEVNSLFGRVTVRSYIIHLVNQKAATTSYPNIDDSRFRELLAKADEATCGNDRASEAIWLTFSALLINVFGFIFYVCMLGSIKLLMVLLIFVTASISYAVTHYVSGYEYRHREEEAEYFRHIQYLDNQFTSVASAKDIRIFGLRFWIEALYQKAFDAYLAFHARAESVLLWGEANRSCHDFFT